jgi:hypothetical protein
MLFRPMLTQLCNRNDQTRQGDVYSGGISKARSSQLLEVPTIHSSFTLDCAKSCVGAAQELLSLIHETHQTEASPVWWYNGLC